jgi:hypothetical protein
VANLHLEQWELLAEFDKYDHQWLRERKRAGIRGSHTLWSGATGVERRVRQWWTPKSFLASQRQRLPASIHDQSCLLPLDQCRKQPTHYQWSDQRLGQRVNSTERARRILPPGATVMGCQIGKAFMRISRWKPRLPDGQFGVS